MADKIFSRTLLSIMRSNLTEGIAMIACSRAILDTTYSEEEFNQQFMSIFILIDEESGHINLSGYGEYNIASLRHNLEKSDINFPLGNDFRKPLMSNYINYWEDIIDIEKSYRDNFLESIDDFKSFFQIK